MKLHYEKEIDIHAEYDVLVAGAGPTGICAAVAAARQGAKVALIERYGVLGGNLTTGFVGPILGMTGPGTMRDEIVNILGVPDNDMIGETGKAHDMEKAKRVLAEFVAREKNIDVYLQCSVYDVIQEGLLVKGLLLASNEGILALLAHTVIDATGDGIVAFLAGAHVEKGRDDGLMQPVTLEFRIEGVDESRGIVCIGDVDTVELNGMRFLDYCKQCADEGKLPQYLAAVRLHPCTRPGERQVNTTQVNRIDSTHIADLFPADVELRQQIDLLVDFLRKNVPGYENIRCIQSGTTTGIRESRRIMGDYVITAKELAEGCRFDDVVVHRAEFIVDIHNPAGAGQAEASIQYCQPYDLPYRCFLPRNKDGNGIEGLLMAGRCISGTHRAHASYRVMSPCMAMGEAIGIAAALSARHHCTPRQLDIALLQKTMTDQGIVLFD